MNHLFNKYTYLPQIEHLISDLFNITRLKLLSKINGSFKTETNLEEKYFD